MQPFTYMCQHCGAALRGGEELVGKFVKCPRCGQKFLARRDAVAAGSSLGVVLFLGAALLVLGGGAFGVYMLTNGGLLDSRVQAKADKQATAAAPDALPSAPGTPSSPAPANGGATPDSGTPNAGDPVSPAVEPGAGKVDPMPVVDPTPPEPTQQPDPPVPPAGEPMKPGVPVKPGIDPNPFKGTDDPFTKGGAYRSPLSKENQQKVNQAIEKGIAFIRSTQTPDGRWLNPKLEESVGYTALPALTLLECGVPATDPAVLKATAYIRSKGPNWRGFYTNYDISLAILFLDRLGDKRDHDLIRFLALRLIAGQQSDGGWVYDSPAFTNQEALDLLHYLQSSRPQPSVLTADGEVVPVPGAVKEPPPNQPAPPDDKGKKPDDKPGGGLKLPFPGGAAKPGAGATPPADAPADTPAPVQPEPVRDPKPLPPGPVEPVFKPIDVSRLSPLIQSLPVVQAAPAFKRNRTAVMKAPANRTDNSNTQFAIMALWVARKYGVPVDRTMALVDQRFQSSQTRDGGWNYNYMEPGATPSMTCVGLIGLAAGHGAHRESLGKAWKMAGGKTAQEDPAIQTGLATISKHIGPAPADWNQKVAMDNLYFVWSVERVAMLYNLKTIGGKDWYSWAAHMLVTNQAPNGSWPSGGYLGESPAINTCLALLTLKRANFVPDLTESLKDYIPIRDPAGKQ